MRTLFYIIIFVLFLSVVGVIFALLPPTNPFVATAAAAVVGAVTAIVTNVIFRDEVSNWLDLFERWMRRQLRSGSELPGTGAIPAPIPSTLDNEIDQFSKFAPPDGAELWVVVSGKGGVGKSLLALGLVEYLSRQEPVVLVDFDLHNRGLTSLLAPSGTAALNAYLTKPSVFAQLRQFRKMLEGGGTADKIYPQLLESVKGFPEGFSRKYTNIINEKFCREARNLPDEWEKFTNSDRLRPNLWRMSEKTGHIPIKHDQVPLAPDNAYFLSSRASLAEESLLLSDESTSPYVTVFLFLRALCYWLGNVGVGSGGGARKVILDCHGAHDLFTVGSMLAAQKLVVVTTTDPGSYDGTAELLNFVSSLRDKQKSRPDTVIVFNSCSSWDPNLDNALKTYLVSRLVVFRLMT